MAPYFNLLEEGVDPKEAWDRTKEEIERKARAGTWQKDFFRKTPSQGGCSSEELKCVSRPSPAFEQFDLRIAV